MAQAMPFLLWWEATSASNHAFARPRAQPAMTASNSGECQCVPLRADQHTTAKNCNQKSCHESSRHAFARQQL
jgi:hypothetical protein